VIAGTFDGEMSLPRKWAWVALVTAAALVWVSVGDGRGFRRYWKLEHEAGQLSERNRQLLEQNAKLSREIEGLRKDPKALERAAREELGFVKPGEIVLNLE
jgi:cell division protein FtsB